MSEAEYGSSNGRNGLSVFGIEANEKASWSDMVRRMWFHIVEGGCDVRCESLVSRLAGLN